MAANRPALIAVGGACATGIFRVAEVPPLPAKAIADRMCRVADGMAMSAAALKCRRFGGRLGCPTWAEVDAAMAASD